MSSDTHVCTCKAGSLSCACVCVYHSHSILRYLEQSILALDVSNEVTRSHMPPVLSNLSQHLARMEKTLESSTGTTGLARQVKRLRMVTEHLCQPHGR